MQMSATSAVNDVLIMPLERKVYVYRPNAPVECLDNPESISGEPLLKGFTLELKLIWG
jgi:Uma2 family endonuclease